MIEENDLNGDGVIDYEEFETMLLKGDIYDQEEEEIE